MIIKVRVIPNSKRNEVVSRIGSILRVKIAAPAVEGKANEELCDYLSDFFDVRRSNILLRKGERGREKTSGRHAADCGRFLRNQREHRECFQPACGRPRKNRRFRFPDRTAESVCLRRCPARTFPCCMGNCGRPCLRERG